MRYSKRYEDATEDTKCRHNRRFRGGWWSASPVRIVEIISTVDPETGSLGRVPDIFFDSLTLPLHQILRDDIAAGKDIIFCFRE